MSRAEARAATRARLFEAASSLFRRAGYHAATLEQVAADAGYTKGAVYSAFASKADLFLALIAERAQQRRETIAALDADASSAQDFARAAAEHMARSTAGERDYWISVIEFMTVVARDPELRSRYAEHHDRTRVALAASIERWARASGRELTLPARTVATLALAITNGLTLETMLSPEELPIETNVTAHVALLEAFTRAAAPGEVPE